MIDAGDKARQRMARKSFAHLSPPSPRRTGAWPMWVAGTLTLVLSFLITLWLTLPAKPPDAGARSTTQSGLSDRRAPSAGR